MEDVLGPEKLNDGCRLISPQRSLLLNCAPRTDIIQTLSSNNYSGMFPVSKTTAFQRLIQVFPTGGADIADPIPAVLAVSLGESYNHIRKASIAGSPG